MTVLGPGGMDPANIQNNTKINHSMDPALQEGVQNGGQAEQPVSVFHSLDNQQQDGKVDYNEAKGSIFSHLNSAGREGTINISSGSHSFKSMFTKVAEKFAGVEYETTDAGVKTVDAKISSAAENINQYVTLMYDQYLQQRDQEATVEIIKQEGHEDTKVYRDAAGKIFKQETVDTKSVTMNQFNDNNQLLTSETKNDKGEVTQSSSNTYNENGQQTSRTYTSNGETYTTEYTYHENGEMATEIVKDSNGNVVEKAEYDENGNETSLEFKTDDVTVRQETDYDKKGNIKSFVRSDSTNDGEATHISQENYDKKGNLRYHQTSFATNNEDAQYTNYNTSTKYRKDGSVQEENTTATSQEGEQFSITNKFKKDGSNRFTRIGMTDANGTNFEETGKDWRIKAESPSAKPPEEQTGQTEETGETEQTQEPQPFDFKGKTPSGFTQIKGYPDHYYDGKGRVYTFTANEEGKPIAKRELSAHARMYEARFKMAKEQEA